MANRRADRSSTGQAVQTKSVMPRSKNRSAKLGASWSERISDLSGVTPDSQALEKTNFGTRSMRPSSLAVMSLPPVKTQPDFRGSPSTPGGGAAGGGAARGAAPLVPAGEAPPGLPRVPLDVGAVAGEVEHVE